MNAFNKLLTELDEQLMGSGTPTGPLLTEEQQEKLQAESFEADRRDVEALEILGQQVVGHEVR